VLTGAGEPESAGFVDADATDAPSIPAPSNAATTTAAILTFMLVPSRFR
jgi:hypothetical protein